MISQIGTVAVYVENQQEAVKFWTEQVGFEIRINMPMGPDGNWIEVSPPGAESRLVLYPQKMMQNWQEMKASIVFFSTDTKKTYEQMKERGVTFTEELKSMPWGSYCRFRDPDGNDFLIKGE